MSPPQSNLSGAKYGYDMVVSTTQEAINSGLTQYLLNTKGKQPVSYMILLADSNGDPTVSVTLEKLLALPDIPDLVNPFDIPVDTPDDDKRLAALKKAKFRFALKLQVGIPPGMIQNVVVPSTNARSNAVRYMKKIVLPKPVVVLGDSANNVLFHLYCSEVSVLRRIPASDDIPGKWVWRGQKPGKPWYIQTRTDLTFKGLDKSLNTTYFDNHPDEKKNILAKLDSLKNVSGSAFSLQQLLLDLDSAVAMSVAEFEGVDDDGISTILSSDKFVKLWTAAAKQKGDPLVSVAAVAQPQDKASLQVTNFERWVSPILDESGKTITNPSDSQQRATTLNYLCATDGHSLPAAASFDWNWIEPDAIAQSSGVMAIKRSTIADYLVKQMLTQYPVTSACKAPWSKVTAKDVVGTVQYECGFSQGTPTVTRHDTGSVVASIEFHPPEARSSGKNAATYGEFNITSSYVCDIILGGVNSSGGNTFSVVQRLEVHFYVQYAASSSNAKPYNTTITDEYEITVDQNGELTCTAIPGRSTKVDASTGGDASAAANAVTGVNNLISKIKSQMDDAQSISMSSISFAQIKNFVFPGAQVFTYKAAEFSKAQDLCALITYVNPTIDQFDPPSNVAAPVHAPVLVHAALQDKQSVEMSLPAVRAAPPAVKTTELSSTAGFVRKWRLENGMRYGASSPSPAVRSATVDTTKMVYPVIRSEGNALTFSSPAEAPSNPGGAAGDTTVRSDSHFDGNDVLRRSTLSTTARQIKLSSTTELMLNYVQGELVKPTGKFRAVQLAPGHGMIFAVNSGGVLTATEEIVGQTSTGWVMKDLSTAFVQQYLAGGTASAWDVAQSVMDDGSIGIGMAIRNGDSDTLCLSLLNSASNTAWTSAPVWKTVPFDVDDAPSSIHITDIYFSETESKQQYILVDILRDPKSASKAISRYIVDPSVPSGCWAPHNLPFDVAEGTYQSCMGRTQNALVDGIYTAGTIANAPQLGYVPLFNTTGDAAPMPTRLEIPGKQVASAIASARNDKKEGDDFGTTDLYAASGPSLYRWGADNQLKDGTLGTPIVSSPTIQGTDTLVALTRSGVTTIFGKNSSNVVYYTSCIASRLADPSAWSVPVPVSAGVEHITSYINCRDRGNTIYAAGADHILQITQGTDASKMWQANRITVTAPPRSKAMSFKSYTTSIQALEADLPAKDVEIQLTTPGRTAVYIEGLYYVLSKDAVTVKTNQVGQVNIVQATESVVGAIITAVATTNGATETVNPMQKSLEKLKGLSKGSDLRAARVVSNPTAGGTIGTVQTESLVPSDVSDDDINAAADSIQALGDAYDKHVTGQATHVAMVHVAQNVRVLGVFDDIRVAAGDLFAWLKTGVEKAWKVIKDVATGIWKFVCTIAGKVYTAILDTMEAVAGAFEWVFDKIKTAVKKVIQFLEFLFDWDDIKRTQRIMHNMAKFYLQDMASTITILQSKFDEKIGDVQKSVAKMAHINDWTPLGDSASKPPGQDAANSTKGQSSSSQMMSNHFRDQSSSLTLTQDIPGMSMVSDLLDGLIDAIDKEGQVLKQTLDQIETLAGEIMKLDVGEILRRLFGILTETVLGSAQVVMDAIFKVLAKVAQSAVDILDAKIHIPIISDILNALGVEDVSFLDIVTWVAATGFTLVYKVINDKSPFPDNQRCRAMADAKDMQSLTIAMHSMNVSVAAVRVGGPMVKAGLPKPSLNSAEEDAIYKAGHSISGFLTWGGQIPVGLEAMDESPESILGKPTALIGIATAVSAGAADFLVSRLPIKDEGFAWTSKATTGATVLCKGWFSGIFQKRLSGALKSEDGRQTGAVVNSVLVIPALVCTCWHFKELSEEPEGKQRSCAIMGETSSMMGYIGRVLYMVAMFQKDPKVRAVPVAGLLATNDVICGLQTAMTVVS